MKNNILNNLFLRAINLNQVNKLNKKDLYKLSEILKKIK
tara:strand:+ start:842 stop:958 length:117 start_codon:yes stop_codon:yes gene_type:complete